MELCIFNKIEDDLCIKGILEKDNVIVLRNIIEFSETEGVTSSAIKEYVATRLANDDNILSRLAQAGKFIGDDLYRLAKFDIEQIYRKLFSTQIKYAPSGNPIGFSNGYVASIRAITESKSAQELLDLLIIPHGEEFALMQSHPLLNKFQGSGRQVSFDHIHRTKIKYSFIFSINSMDMRRVVLSHAEEHFNDNSIEHSYHRHVYLPSISDHAQRHNFLG